MLNSIKAGTSPDSLKKVTHRQLAKTVTYGAIHHWNLHSPADLIRLAVATPTQWTVSRNEAELTAIQTKQLSKQAFREAVRRLKRHCSKSPNELQASSGAGHGLLLSETDPRFVPIEAKEAYG